jgi:long-chain acyl-CoA synthetase
MNVAECVERGARQYPDQEAILFEGDVISYGRLHDDVVRIAAGLQALGVRPGDRVALFLPNIPAFATVYFACQWLGAITVSINVMLTTEELRYILEDSGAMLVVTAEALWPRLEPLVGAVLGSAARVIVAEGAVAGTTALETLGDGLAPPPLTERDATAPAAILYTSGTTGRQKGATLSVGNILFNAAAKHRYMGITAESCVISFLPMFHVFAQNGILVTALTIGGTVSLHRRFDLEAMVDSIERDRVTTFMAVPTIYITLLNAGIDPKRLASVGYYFSAAATMPQEIAQRWRDLTGLPIYEGYGLTETSPLASYNHIAEYRAGSVGTAIDQVEMRIVDADDQPVSTGGWGEICVRGPNIMLGYWNRPTETAEALRGGWFHTGDVGYMDQDGYVFIVDRTKDMINVAGFKIWPREVEEVLYEHPAIQECAVIGVPDPVKGEAAIGMVVLKAGQQVTGEALEAYCREHLATYKVPRRFEVRDALPKSATGKILKRVLRDEAAAEAPSPAGRGLG